MTRQLVDPLVSAGRSYLLGLYGSVAIVVALMRRNITQEFAGAIFGVSQPTVSRRWDLLHPAIADALAPCAHPAHAAGESTVLVDGTICPTWDRTSIPELLSCTARDTTRTPSPPPA